MPHKILIIEDEPAIADTLIYALQTDGFAVSWKNLARAGLQHLQQEGADLLILDVGLPDQNGFELCKDIRQFSQVPILFLTARKEEMDRIIGLEIGGDDYVTKPFSPREISARVKTILRRVQGSATAPVAAATAAPASASWFDINTAKAQVKFHGQKLELTRYEYLIILTLLEHPEQVFSRTQLMDRVWDEPEASFERAVDTHIKSLRAKLKAVRAEDSPIQTHRGMGYSIKAHA